MYFKPTAPLTTGGVFATTWRLYRVSIRHSWPLALLAALQSALLAAWLLQPTRAFTAAWNDAMLNLDLNLDLQALTLSGLQFARASAGPAILSSVVSTLLSASIIVAPLALAQGERPVGASGAFGVALRRLPGILLGSALTLLLIGAGLLLLLLPGFYWWARVQLWLVPLLGERAAAMRAIGRSWELTRDHWWRVSTLLSVAIAVVWLGTAAGGWIGAALGGLAAPVPHSGTSPEWTLGMLIGNATRVFTLPYLAAMLVVLYEDLALRAVLANARSA
jgi:hypothetical protein